MVKVCEIEKIKYYRNSCIIQNNWKIYLNIKKKSENHIISFWNIKKNKKNINRIFLCIFKLKYLNNCAQKIQKIWKIKNIKIKIKNENCPISMIPLNDIVWSKKILLEYEGTIYGFLLEDLFSYYSSGNCVLCPYTRRQLRYYEVFNILKKKFKMKNQNITTEESLLIVNNFLLMIENVINKQEDFDNTTAILTQDLEFYISNIFRYLLMGVWNSEKQMITNRIFLKIILIAYRYNLFNPTIKQNLPLTLKNDIIQKLEIYFRNYTSMYFFEIEENVKELFYKIFKNSVIKAFNYCDSIIYKKKTYQVDNIIRLINQEIITNN